LVAVSDLSDGLPTTKPGVAIEFAEVGDALELSDVGAQAHPVERAHLRANDGLNTS